MDLKIKIIWLQDGVNQQREMNDFFNANEDPAVCSPHKCNSLKSSETKKVINCPIYSGDGKIEVLISGTDILGGHYTEKQILTNKLKK
ncbi:MAG: hypothetical protein WCT18_05075 [Patescibacteria group bacterium]